MCHLTHAGTTDVTIGFSPDCSSLLLPSHAPSHLAPLWQIPPVRSGALSPRTFPAARIRRRDGLCRCCAVLPRAFTGLWALQLRLRNRTRHALPLNLDAFVRCPHFGSRCV
eukprot:scaffold171324_cov24-Tisochrysis_lutea.AAC.1